MCQPVLKTICLIACHGGPADHFATFAEELTRDGYQVEVYASGPALKKFEERHIEVIEPFNADAPSESLAEELAEKCAHASAVITDVGHSFDVTLQKALASKAPETLRIAYYDNPESFVPGGYSATAATVMFAAQRVLFANANLQKAPVYETEAKEISLPHAQRIGLGYYPTSQAEGIAKRRSEEKVELRSKLFEKYGIVEKGQKFLVYFGGNNTAYFEQAFPALLGFAQEVDLSNVVIALQQHPGAARGSNLDFLSLGEWNSQHAASAKAPKIFLSKETTETMQVVCDGGLYYQTSMGPLMALAGIPLVQVAHETYPDLVVRSGLCPSVTSGSGFAEAVQGITPVTVSEERAAAIRKGLGIDPEWYNNLKTALATSN
jgi:hypothetical protein